MENLKVLVLGGGFFGKNWLRELSACRECEVAGLVAKHPDILAAAGEEFSIPAARRFATVAEGLDRAGAQAVVVALPEMVHKDAILAALGRGLHVLTEKPLAMTMAEAREIVRAARSVPASVVMVDQNYRWRPQTEDAAGGGPRRTDREDRLDRLRIPPADHPHHHRCLARADAAPVPARHGPPPLRPTARLYRAGVRAGHGQGRAPRVELVSRACPPWTRSSSFEGGVSASYTGTMVARGLGHAPGWDHHGGGRGRHAAPGGRLAGPLVRRERRIGGDSPGGDAVHRSGRHAAGVPGRHPGGAEARRRTWRTTSGRWPWWRRRSDR